MNDMPKVFGLKNPQLPSLENPVLADWRLFYGFSWQQLLAIACLVVMSGHLLLLSAITF
jgi:Na+/H+ antiporter NhaB